ncbi:DNA translocase FtsK [Planococcus alpniumensis]|uniref:DNA translocase FtsK n=1 Tax=Planococcus alpniumensis TaxID=2708345 RepID=UPI001B8A94DD|nr:DNA translocase FtsK [Planococcus sp. MSAK28401]
MSWMKNMWNKMFTEDTETEEKPFVHSEEIQHSQTKPQDSKPAPFRFPLISDEEAKGMPVENRKPERREEKPRFDAPLKETEEKPYELDALEPSGKLPKPNAGRNKKKRPHVPKTAEPQGLDLPGNTTRRFQPTRVASPVHGFTDRPAPIDELLEQEAKKRAELERKNDWSQRSLQELYKKSDDRLPQAKKPNSTMETTVYKPVEQKEQAPETASASEKPHENALAEEDQQVEKKPEPHYEWADRSLQDLLPKNQKVDQEPEKTPEQESEQAEVTVYRTADQEQPSNELADAGNPEENGEVFEEGTGKGGPTAIVEPPVTESKAHENTAVTAKPESEREDHIHSPDPKPVLPQAKTQDKGKKERTVPFNVLMLKSDKERLPKQQQAPIAEKKTALIEETAAEPANLTDSSHAGYQLPAQEYLLEPENDLKDETWMEEQGHRLIEALSHFQIKAEIVGTVQGPAVTRFELRVAQGIKVSKIRNLADDLKLALAARDIRIQAPIPGKSSIGIEIPNRQSRAVRLSEVIGSPNFKASDSPLEAALGLDLAGNPVTLDLRKMPHGLIAGATGSGKSVCINSLLISLLYQSSPRDLKMLLIDPKMVELAPYNHIPHLVSPVITDVKAATASLKWAVEEMERRYQLFAHTGVRDLDRYNKMVNDKGQPAQHLPYILIVIDELADLMMMSPSDVEDSICRIAQKARACGIHLVIATQRPSVDVITGLIKSNIPTRIAFSVSSQVDSRTILDTQGAERLLGRGDMLYLGNGMAAPNRLQGTFVTDDEIEKVIAHVRAQGEPDYIFKEEELMQRSQSPAEQDDLFEEACRFIMSQGSASTSLLQRKFHIGYNRAARLMDLIEEYGFISEQNGSKARTVLITESDIEEVFR